MILRALSQQQLQGLIAPAILNRLERLLPSISKKSDGYLYTKDGLIEILLSFTHGSLFSDSKFRKFLFEHLHDDDLGKICAATNTIAGPSRAEKIEPLLARGWVEKEFCANFLQAAGLPNDFLPPAQVTQQSDNLSLDQAEHPFRTLKEYQTGVFFESLRKLEIPRSRFIVQMPTGSGKTRTAIELICELLNNAKEPITIVWLAHSEELCEQAAECFLQVWPHVASRKISFSRYWGGYSSFPKPLDTPSFVVCGFQKAYRSLGNNSEGYKVLRDTVSAIFIDEAHMAIAPSYSEVIRTLTGHRSNVIGLTATPGRSQENDKENQKLSEFFFNEIVSIRLPTEIKVDPIQFLRQKGVLAKALFVELKGGSYSLNATDIAYIENNFDYSPGFLLTLADDDIRNIEIIRSLEQQARSGKKILFFGCSVEHSKFICALLTYLGIQTAHVDGATSRDARRSVINKFRKGELSVLCNYGVLSTGFDAPQTDVVFIARPTQSLVLYSQMIGRGLRGPAMGGTEECTVIQVKDTIKGMQLEDYIYAYFKDYWN